MSHPAMSRDNEQVNRSADKALCRVWVKVKLVKLNSDLLAAARFATPNNLGTAVLYSVRYHNKYFFSLCTRLGVYN